jgi:predicted nuclease with TOPRIM domain
MNRTIQEYLNQPNELEKLYRKDSEQFKARFNELYPSVEHTDIVNVWYERLNYREDMLS